MAGMQAHAPAVPEANVALAKDPICGMMVAKATALISERNGRLYYFCSPTCQRTFEDPERELRSMRTRVTVALTGVLLLAILRAGAFIALAAGATLLTWAPIPQLSDDEVLRPLVHVGHDVGVGGLGRHGQPAGAVLDDEPPSQGRHVDGDVPQHLDVDVGVVDVGAVVGVPALPLVLHGQSCPHSAGRAVRRFGQQPGAHTDGRTSSPAQTAGSGASPRA